MIDATPRPPSKALDLDAIEQLIRSLGNNGHPEGDICIYCDIGPAGLALKHNLPLLVARIRQLEAENADLRERPCAHRWTGTEQGIRCTYCGLVE